MKKKCRKLPEKQPNHKQYKCVFMKRNNNMNTTTTEKEKIIIITVLKKRNCKRTLKSRAEFDGGEKPNVEMRQKKKQ